MSHSQCSAHFFKKSRPRFFAHPDSKDTTIVPVELEGFSFETLQRTVQEYVKESCEKKLGANCDATGFTVSGCNSTSQELTFGLIFYASTGSREWNGNLSFTFKPNGLGEISCSCSYSEGESQCVYGA